MQITSPDFRHLERIPARFAFGALEPGSRMRLSDNCNPGLDWTGAPAGTRSFVLACIDSDVPTRPDDVNQEGRTVPASLPRTDFCHWVMVDIPPTVTRIATGSASSGITPRGKQQPGGPVGSRQGINDYTGWFASDADMSGQWFGYDGPCPPWNDELLHHYHFIVYATDLARCPVDSAFAWPAVKAAIAGHVLAEARITGTYSLNPAV